MYKKLTYTVLLFFVVGIFQLQGQVLQSWVNLFNQTGLQGNVIFSLCPHFPDIKKYTKDIDWQNAIQQWEKSYPQEVISFKQQEKVKALGIVESQFGLTAPTKAFENSWWEWITASGITDERLKVVAPNFPKPIITQQKATDEANYQLALDRWRILYSHEYEALINSPELQKNNPNYDGYQDVIKLPYYIQALSNKEKPVTKNTGNAYQDEINHQLQLMTWYFVFEPNSFASVFGFEPDLPKDFDADTYRKNIINRIERQEQLEKGLVTKEQLMQEEYNKKR